MFTSLYRYLVADLSQECYKGWHIAFLTFAVVACIVYCFGIPLALTLLLLCKVEEIHDTKDEEQANHADGEASLRIDSKFQLLPMKSIRSMKGSKGSASAMNENDSSDFDFDDSVTQNFDTSSSDDSSTDDSGDMSESSSSADDSEDEGESSSDEDGMTNGMEENTKSAFAIWRQKEQKKVRKKKKKRKQRITTATSGEMETSNTSNAFSMFQDLDRKRKKGRKKLKATGRAEASGDEDSKSSSETSGDEDDEPLVFDDPNEEWTKVHSAEHDAHYWKNELTNEKTWDDPTAGDNDGEWVKCHSEEHGAHYWKHQLTLEKTWVRPPELGESDGNKYEGVEGAASDIDAGFVDEWGITEGHPTEEWTRHYSEDHAAFFWQHHGTADHSQWTEPTPEETVKHNQHALAERSRARKGTSITGLRIRDRASQMMKKILKKKTTAHERQKKMMELQMMHVIDDDERPDETASGASSEWKQMHSAEHDAHYWERDHITNETTWEDPTEGDGGGGSSSEWKQMYSAEHDAHYWERDQITSEKTWARPLVQGLELSESEIPDEGELACWFYCSAGGSGLMLGPHSLGEIEAQLVEEHEEDDLLLHLGGINGPRLPWVVASTIVSFSPTFHESEILDTKRSSKEEVNSLSKLANRASEASSILQQGASKMGEALAAKAKSRKRKEKKARQLRRFQEKLRKEARRQQKDKWFYKGEFDGKEYGPYSRKQLRDWFKDGFFGKFDEFYRQCDVEEDKTKTLIEVLRLGTQKKDAKCYIPRLRVVKRPVGEYADNGGRVSDFRKSYGFLLAGCVRVLLRNPTASLSCTQRRA